MEKLTLRRSTILGTVQGKPVLSSVRAVPDGLMLPAGQYLLYPPVENPVYGQVMAIESLPASAAAPGDYHIKSSLPTSAVGRPPSALKDSPAHIKDTQMRAPAAVKDLQSLAAGTVKLTSPSMKFDSPSMKFFTSTGEAAPLLVITSRPIAGNGFVVTSGMGDLFDTVNRAGGVILVVE